MVSRTELEALRQTYPELPWPRGGTQPPSGSWPSDPPPPSGRPGGRGTPGTRGGAAMTFVVRLSRDETGHIRGVVERVRTGEKARFDALDALVEVIGRMVARETPSREVTEGQP